MNVFTVYSPDRAPSLRLWVRSWQTQGYTPRLVGAREAETPIKRVMRRRGGGIFVEPGVFNLGHRRGPVKVRKYGTRGWHKSKAVFFPTETPEEVILKCLQKDH